MRKNKRISLDVFEEQDDRADKSNTRQLWQSKDIAEQDNLLDFCFISALIEKNLD